VQEGEKKARELEAKIKEAKEKIESVKEKGERKKLDKVVKELEKDLSKAQFVSVHQDARLNYRTIDLRVSSLPFTLSSLLDVDESESRHISNPMCG